MLFGQNVVTCSDFGKWVLSACVSEDRVQNPIKSFFSLSGGALASTTQMSWSKAVNSRSFHSELSSSVIAVSKRKGIGYLDLRAVAPTTAWLYYYPLFIVTWMFLMLGKHSKKLSKPLCIWSFGIQINPYLFIAISDYSLHCRWIRLCKEQTGTR
jgi:hypothetical protein